MEGTVNFPTGVQVRSRDEAPDTRASPSPDPRRDRRLGSLSSRSVAFFREAEARRVRARATSDSPPFPPSPACRQVAHLALKHRQNKHQRMRIVLFIGSPVEAETSELISVGKKLRKCNVAVDVVSFGDVDENAEKLEAFMGAVNKNNNSNLVTVPPGANLADVLLSTPIFMDEDSGGKRLRGRQRRRRRRRRHAGLRRRRRHDGRWGRPGARARAARLAGGGARAPGGGGGGGQRGRRRTRRRRRAGGGGGERPPPRRRRRRAPPRRTWR